MSKLKFKDEGEEHNFWQNYTDLMSGFLVVFIIASMVAYASYKTYVDIFNEVGVSEGNIDDIVVEADLFKQISSFQEAQKTLSERATYFRYNDAYNRFECKEEVLFPPEDYTNIPESYKPLLINAAVELDSIMSSFMKQVNSDRIGFSIVIDGRLALRHGMNPTKAQSELAKQRGKDRAMSFYKLLKEQGIIDNWEKSAEGVFVTGSGYGGSGRYSGYGKDGEDKNKTVIIQILPFIRFSHEH